jgi:hypothetical protein
VVAEINWVAKLELDLQRHLFGSDRPFPLGHWREGIAEIQPQTWPL